MSIENANKKERLLVCGDCPRSYYLIQYNHLGERLTKPPLPEDRCICGSKNVTIDGVQIE